MTEQTILLLCLFGALAATLGLYFLKAFKQTMYQGDERWQAIQLKAEAAANATNWLLLFVLLGATVFAGGETTLTLNRIGTLYMDLLRLSQPGGADRRPLFRPSAVTQVENPAPSRKESAGSCCFAVSAGPVDAVDLPGSALRPRTLPTRQCPAAAGP